MSEREDFVKMVSGGRMSIHDVNRKMRIFEQREAAKTEAEAVPSTDEGPATDVQTEDPKPE